jgi:uncharacterized membrane protein YeiH
LIQIARPRTEHLLIAVDYLGTLLFAIEGAMAAIRAGLDLLGVVVLAFLTALGGGIVRDLLIGAVPPASIKNWRVGCMAFFGAGLAFCFHGLVGRIPEPLMIVLDAAGLALFAVSGATKALEYEIHPFVAVLMGTMTGVGGGTLRDIMLANVPSVLRSDIYAVAAMAGSAVLVIGMRLGQSPTAMACIGGVSCFALRIVAVWRHWNLPSIRAS